MMKIMAKYGAKQGEMYKFWMGLYRRGSTESLNHSGVGLCRAGAVLKR